MPESVSGRSQLSLAFVLCLVATLSFGGALSLKAQEKAAASVQKPANGTTQVPTAAQSEAHVPSATQQALASMEPGTLKINAVGSVSYPGQWQPSGAKYSNAHQLVRVPSAKVNPSEAAPKSNAIGPLAYLLITTEKRTSHGDAVRRLQELAHSRRANVRFYAISTWPAAELQFTQKLPMRGQQEQLPDQDRRDFAPPIVQRAIVAVAVEDDLVSFDVMLGPETPKEVLKEGLEIANSFAAAKSDNREDLTRTLQQLEQDYNKKISPQPPPAKKRPSDLGSLEENAGASAVQGGGVGELEIAATPNGKTIVIASNASLTQSSNGGKTFTPGSAVFPLNDPTLGRGVSNDFYLGQIALPNGTPSQKGVTGCTNAVSRSTNGGVSFQLRGFSAVCPPGALNVIFGNFCSPDQPHIAADSFTPGANEQVYAVWRMIFSINIFGLAGTTNCQQVTGGIITPSISCSQDSGATWTSRADLSGFDDFPRVAVGKDGKVYVVGMSGDSVVLSRFTSCRNGLLADAGFPVTVANLSGQVSCPVPGLDRCENGNILSSPTVAPDPQKAEHLSVSFAETDGFGGERVVTMESNDSGATFPTQFTLSAPTSARRFMPWSCMAGGNTFVGWYDRGSATSARNDLTDYLVGGTILASPKNLSKNPDPQCALWTAAIGGGKPFACVPRSQNDSQSCSVQPERAGICLNGSGGGSGKRCDFSTGTCPSGESCQTGGGCPKYGDYNGMACANQLVVAAWASATPPKGVNRPMGTGISIFSQTFSIKKTGPPTFDQVEIGLMTGNDNAGSGVELFATISGQKHPFCLKPSTSLPPDGICPNGNGAHDQNGLDTWENWTSRNETYTLDTPQPSTADFKKITITSLQSSCNTYCDNWDIQGITVAVSDSSKKLKPAILLNFGNQRDPNNSDNCIARLKAPPNPNSVTYTLDAAKPGSSPSDFGPTPPGNCPQPNPR